MLEKIIQEAGFMKKKYPEIREGQALMSSLFENHRLVYDWISGTEFDPFYDDKRIDSFKERVQYYFE